MQIRVKGEIQFAPTNESAAIGQSNLGEYFLTTIYCHSLAYNTMCSHLYSMYPCKLHVVMFLIDRISSKISLHGECNHFSLQQWNLVVSSISAALL